MLLPIFFIMALLLLLLPARLVAKAGGEE